MLHKKLFAVLAILLGMAGSFGAFAQKLTVSGTVLDNAGPVVGAVVQAKGANAVTDMDGKFAVSVASNDVLEVSCLGYVTQLVPVGGRTNLTIVLEEDSFVLEDAVAVGYGTTKKTNLTGAVSVLKSESLKDRSALDVAHMLQGSVPGLNITSASGRPGQAASLNIRGWNSINGGSPLVLIDGVEG